MDMDIDEKKLNNKNMSAGMRACGKEKLYGREIAIDDGCQL